jgi:hypothetical protein
MGGMFSKPKTPKAPPPPKPVRMPVETDPAVQAAAERTRAASMMRQGRLSTILTDQTRGTSGSSGQKLGA